MHLTHLSLTNFRNFARLDLDIPRRVVMLVGSNAQGKTSLVEAIYFLASFSSFQTHADRQLVNFIAVREARGQVVVGRMVADYHRGGSPHRLEVRLILEPMGVNGLRLRKEVLSDGVKRQLNAVIGQFNAVLFVPQMSQILEGGPDERRRYLDQMLSQTVSNYAFALSEYNQAVSQRNALLKTLNEQGGKDDQLGVWDEAVARLGAKIILWRVQAVQEIERLAARVHHHLTRSKEVLRLNYQPAFDPIPQPEGQLGLKIDTPVDRSGLELEEVNKGFAERLLRLRGEEIARGVTTIGPHRDELRFLANNIDLGDYGSRGQMRTALLSLKLAEVKWMKERTGEWPAVLLDEVMAELDRERREDLLNNLGENEQVFITTTDLGPFAPDFLGNAEIWRVQNGTIKVKD